eukprot:6490648-Amphidinium_carterae.2
MWCTSSAVAEKSVTKPEAELKNCWLAKALGCLGCWKMVKSSEVQATCLLATHVWEQIFVPDEDLQQIVKQNREKFKNRCLAFAIHQVFWEVFMERLAAMAGTKKVLKKPSASASSAVQQAPTEGPNKTDRSKRKKFEEMRKKNLLPQPVMEAYEAVPQACTWYAMKMTGRARQGAVAKVVNAAFTRKEKQVVNANELVMATGEETTFKDIYSETLQTPKKPSQTHMNNTEEIVQQSRSRYHNSSDKSCGLARALVLCGGKQGLEDLPLHLAHFDMVHIGDIAHFQMEAILEGDCKKVVDPQGRCRYYFYTDELGEAEKTDMTRAGNRTLCACYLLLHKQDVMHAYILCLRASHVSSQDSQDDTCLDSIGGILNVRKQSACELPHILKRKLIGPTFACLALCQTWAELKKVVSDLNKVLMTAKKLAEEGDMEVHLVGIALLHFVDLPVTYADRQSCLAARAS